MGHLTKAKQNVEVSQILTDLFSEVSQILTELLLRYRKFLTDLFVEVSQILTNLFKKVLLKQTKRLRWLTRMHTYNMGENDVPYLVENHPRVDDKT